MFKQALTQYSQRNDAVKKSHGRSEECFEIDDLMLTYDVYQQLLMVVVFEGACRWHCPSTLLRLALMQPTRGQDRTHSGHVSNVDELNASPP